MKKGFTLIELLAVIVILAVIALIAVPIIVNIIRDTKEKAIKINAENYMDAVELAVADGHMVKGEKVLISGTYDIIENGKVIKLIKDANDKPILEEKDQIELQVKYTGEGLKDGIVKLIDGKVRKVTDVMTNEDYHVLIILGEVKIFKKVNLATLTTGEKFNSKIKTLVNGTYTQYGVADTKITSIEFLAYGILPIGYTLEEFQKLEKVDVSANSDETIYAIYDGVGKVYIYAEDEIVFNKFSNYMFYGFSSVENILFGDYIDTTNVTNMYEMFRSCSNLTAIDVSNFDTSRVTNMSYMFSWCVNITTLDLSNFDTSSVVNMKSMFYLCKKLETLDVSNFDTSSVVNMELMFYLCEKLETLDLNNFDTSQVTNMSSMFSDCSGLTKLDVSNFDTAKVTDMDRMFEYCSKLTELDVSNWNTINVSSMWFMFNHCSSLVELDVSKFDTKNVINMRRLFSSCISLSSLDLSNWNTSQVTSMKEMFFSCISLSSLDLSNFDTSQVTNVVSMFEDTPNLKPIYVGEKWIINETTNVTDMFKGSKTKTVEELCESGSTEEWCVVTG